MEEVASNIRSQYTIEDSKMNKAIQDITEYLKIESLKDTLEHYHNNMLENISVTEYLDAFDATIVDEFGHVSIICLIDYPIWINTIFRTDTVPTEITIDVGQNFEINAIMHPIIIDSHRPQNSTLALKNKKL